MQQIANCQEPVFEGSMMYIILCVL